MKKLFIAAPLLGALLFNSSCKKEPEVIVETVTVTDTLTITQNNSVGLSLQPFNQIYIGAGFGYGSATVDYSVNNLGDKKISTLKVTFEATADDNTTYTAIDYIFDLEVGETTNSQGYVSTSDKECKSIKVKELEITTD